MNRFFHVLALGLNAVVLVSGCGARSGMDEQQWLPVDGESSGSSGAGTGGAGQGGAGQGGAGQGGAGQGGAGQGGAGQGGAGMAGMPACVEGSTQSCGSAVGACKPGTQVCHDGEFGGCTGTVGPFDETCNGIDDNCNGTVDDGFHIGEPCKGNGTDQCLDGVTTCNGCMKTGPEKVEICNGVDDNCNGTIDADCEVGDCEPTLLVTGSTPSSPSCIDFPVVAGSQGKINYPCGGGPVTATLNGIEFSGSVTNNFVSIDGVAIIPPNQSPDGCTWKTSHHIEGVIPSGNVSYSYTEEFIAGVNCWSPCTEVGDVQIIWVASP